MGKITVKHYLNKAVKPKLEGDKELYPLYVQVIVNQTNFRFKSNFSFGDGYLKQSDLAQEFVNSIIETEEREIKKIVEGLIDSGKKDLLTAKFIKKCSENLWDVINRNFSKYFEKESEILGYNFPKLFENKDFFDIEEVLIFTESEIETKFTEDYRYCRMGMQAIKRSLFDKEFKHLQILKLTVYDFLYRHGIDKVLKAIKMTHSFYGGDEEREYNKILEQIRKIIEIE